MAAFAEHRTHYRGRPQIARPARLTGRHPALVGGRHRRHHCRIAGGQAWPQGIPRRQPAIVSAARAVNSIIAPSAACFPTARMAISSPMAWPTILLSYLEATNRRSIIVTDPGTTPPSSIMTRVTLGRWVRGLEHPGSRRYADPRREHHGRTGRERPIASVDFMTRYGAGDRARPTGFIDASGDAALLWQAGFPVPRTRQLIASSALRWSCSSKSTRRASRRVRKSARAMKKKGEKYGLVRREGLGFNHSRPRHRRHEHDPTWRTPLDPGSRPQPRRWKARSRPRARAWNSLKRSFPSVTARRGVRVLRPAGHPPDALDRRTHHLTG